MHVWNCWRPSIYWSTCQTFRLLTAVHAFIYNKLQSFPFCVLQKSCCTHAFYVVIFTIIFIHFTLFNYDFENFRKWNKISIKFQYGQVRYIFMCVLARVISWHFFCCPQLVLLACTPYCFNMLINLAWWVLLWPCAIGFLEVTNMP